MQLQGQLQDFVWCYLKGEELYDSTLIKGIVVLQELLHLHESLQSAWVHNFAWWNSSNDMWEQFYSKKNCQIIILTHSLCEKDDSIFNIIALLECQ